METVVNASLAETLGTSNRQPTALQDASLIQQLDIINRQFVNAAHSREPSRGWEWMEDVTSFQTKNNTTLNGAITTASTSVVLTSGTDFDSGGGRVYVRTSNNAVDFIDYTARSSNTLTGATDIDIGHASGESVDKCYALPSTYGKAVSLILDDLEYVYVKTPHLPVYRTYTTRGAYIVLPWSIGTHDATFWFEKAPTDLSSGSDASSITTDKAKSLDIPDDFMRYPIAKLKAYIYRVDGQDERVPDCEAEAAAALESAFAYNTSTTTSIGLRPSY